MLSGLPSQPRLVQRPPVIAFIVVVQFPTPRGENAHRFCGRARFLNLFSQREDLPANSARSCQPTAHPVGAASIADMFPQLPLNIGQTTLNIRTKPTATFSWVETV